MGTRLSDSDRLARYRKLESEARRAGAASKSIELRNAYGDIAKAWATMAADIEQRIRNQHQISDPFEDSDSDVARPPAASPASRRPLQK
jgi:hypothetical protein